MTVVVKYLKFQDIQQCLIRRTVLTTHFATGIHIKLISIKSTMLKNFDITVLFLRNQNKNYGKLVKSEHSNTYIVLAQLTCDYLYLRKRLCFVRPCGHSQYFRCQNTCRVIRYVECRFETYRIQIFNDRMDYIFNIKKTLYSQQPNCQKTLYQLSFGFICANKQVFKIIQQMSSDFPMAIPKGN